MPAVFISAAHKSSGKTTLSIGLCAALRNAGTKVQAFKKGPDYIDPMWLSTACGRPCYNLDFYTMAHAEISTLYARHAADADLALIEGNKGLYDGLDLKGTNSNAALAAHLGAPVVLVLDARGMTRGIAPLVLGYQAFEPALNISAVILNQVGGSRHESKLRAILEHYTDVSVIGAVHRDPRLTIDERHLGLVPSNESADVTQKISDIAGLVAAQVDLERLRTVAAAASPLPPVTQSALPHRVAGPALRIGILRDAAFGFYYPDDLSAFEEAGATLLRIDALNDHRLPELDGLFIGGGFPETHAAALSANHELRHQLKSRIEQGLPTYAECGGLMYLARSLRWRGHSHEMVGVIPGDVVMHDRPQGRGYVVLEPTAEHPWPEAGPNSTIHAHEFHYSSLENLPAQSRYAYRVTRGTGISQHRDGLILYNLLANYSHFRNLDNNNWVRRFLLFVQQNRPAAHTEASGH